MSFSFIDQMEENTKFMLKYPYHLDNSKLSTPNTIPLPAKQVAVSFKRVLQKAYNEPFAVSLTEEDRKFYSQQEQELFDRVVAREQQQINDGMCKIDLELSEASIERIIAYKESKNLTFEEAVIDILRKIVDSNTSN